MMTNFNESVIPYYSPISAKGGRRKNRKHKTRKNKKSKIHSKNRRTKRRYQ